MQPAGAWYVYNDYVLFWSAWGFFALLLRCCRFVCNAAHRLALALARLHRATSIEQLTAPRSPPPYTGSCTASRGSRRLRASQLHTTCTTACFLPPPLYTVRIRSLRRRPIVAGPLGQVWRLQSTLRKQSRCCLASMLPLRDWCRPRAHHRRPWHRPLAHLRIRRRWQRRVRNALK